MTRTSIFDDLPNIGQRQRELAIEEGRGCEHCGSTVEVSRGPRGCSYHHDGQIGDASDPNYATLCAACFEQERERWEEMWAEYYRGCL